MTFSISGQINDLPAESINAFVTYSHKKVEGIFTRSDLISKEIEMKFLEITR